MTPEQTELVLRLRNPAGEWNVTETCAAAADMIEALAGERDRCTRIVMAARMGDIDTDLRTLLHFIKSGDQMLRNEASHEYEPDYKRRQRDELPPVQP